MAIIVSLCVIEQSIRAFGFFFRESSSYVLKETPTTALPLFARHGSMRQVTLNIQFCTPICGFDMDLNAVFSCKKLLVALSLVLLGFFSAFSAVFLVPLEGFTKLAVRGDEGRCENPLGLPDSKYFCLRDPAMMTVTDKLMGYALSRGCVGADHDRNGSAQ